MELEIGSPHKSLLSVGSLVWPGAVPRLRSLSTERSQAKHIFIDCACVCECLLEREARVAGPSVDVRFFRAYFTKQKAPLRSVHVPRHVAVKFVTRRHFLIANWPETNDVFAELKSLPSTSN